MPTQQEINLAAYKSGKTPEEIQRLLQEKQGIAPAPIVPNQVPNLQQNAPVPGNTMDSSTGAPYIAPTPPIMNWETIGKQKDPTQVSNYLNTQPGFKTTVNGNTVTGTKNGVNTTWIYDGANWVTKPTIATGDSPVIGTPPATTPTTTTTDFTVMTPEQLKSRYMEIGTKLPGEVTDEDRKFTRYLQTRMSLGETPDVIFGTKGTKSSGTTTYSTELTQPGENIASSVRNSDGTYKVTYKDGTTQITTSEPSTTVFPEGTPEYFAQKQAQEANKRLQVLEEQLNSEAERRKKETADLVAKYGENIATQFQNQKAEIEANGAKRIDALNTGLSFSGFGRSTLALEKRDEIAKNIETTINQAKAKADLELMAYRMEREGADATAIEAMRSNIASVQQQIDDANYANQLEIIKLNQQNATTGAEAMNNLLATISDSEEIVSNADLEKSQMLGYFVNKDGSIMLDSQKRPIQFEGNPGSLDPSSIGAYADALSKGIIDEKGLDKLSPSDKAAVLKHVGVLNGTYEGFGAIDVPRNVNGTTNNVGQDTNNPGNIMADSDSQKNYAKGLGAIGFYSSPNGRTYAVFPDMETGYKAMVRDIQGKINGTSTWANANTTLAKFATGWVSGPNAPANSSAIAAYVKATGYPANTPIGQIPIEKLIEAIIKHEGVDISRSANIPFTGTGGGGVFSDNQKNVMDNIVGEPTLAQTKELSSVGLNTGDLQSYRQEKKSTGDYSTQDLDFIGKIDEKVTKSKVYQDINSSQQFISNLMVALDRNSALGDIAAINQFQKIIDEGAVTRDQDVKLVQSAESLLGKMKLVYDKVQNGQQLTQNQRNEMRAIGKQLLDGKSKIFYNDPGIKALRKQLSSRGIKEDAGIFGEVGIFDTGTTPTGQTGASGTVTAGAFDLDA